MAITIGLVKDAGHFLAPDAPKALTQLIRDFTRRQARQGEGSEEASQNWR